MCMFLDKKSKRLTRNYRRRSNPIVVWKVLNRKRLTSPINPFRWTYDKVYISSRKSCRLKGKEVFLTYNERESKKVRYGFHFYIYKVDALTWMGSGPYSIVKKFLVNPKDVVAVGNDGTRLVAYKAKMVKE